LEDYNQLIKIRREKLEKIRQSGVNPYPTTFNQTHKSTQIIARFEELEEKEVGIAGRIMSVRLMGKAAFCHIQDEKGRIQAYLRKDQVGEQSFEMFKMLDIGDYIGINGQVFKTRTGEITIFGKKLILLSKSIRPLPIVKEKEEDGKKVVFDQFADKELRYRQRYVDLIVNPEVKEVFVKRSKIISAIRGFLDENEFLEVETPILQPVYGGAAARPFVTHHHTLDRRLYLRIADELYLKRLIVGGFDRVYEISKDFRNEGMDRYHNPEFTMLEFYVAYKDYRWMMDFIEQLFRQVAQTVLGRTHLLFNNQEIDLQAPWKRLTMFGAIKEYTGMDLSAMDETQLHRAADRLKVATAPEMGPGKIIDEIFGELVEPHLIQPTFLMDYPLEMSPLAKKHAHNPRLVERFELMIGGKEIVNAFSELNDPVDQRERFLEQVKLKARGDLEAQEMDEDFLRALEIGMPPTAGVGIGIDRLVMLLTGQPSIRDVIFFPQMRPENK